MITKIGDPLIKYDKVINYHEKKVKEGKAKTIFSPLYEFDKNNIIEHLNRVGEKNINVKNKGFDISINFNLDDKVSDIKAQTIIKDYLISMGYNENPYIIYRHNDKDHLHYHIVVSNVDYLGNYNQKMRGFYKKDSQRISRDLELKYNLITTSYKSTSKNESLESINYDAYQMQKAINSSLKNNGLKKEVENLLGEIKPLLIKNKLNNQYLSVLLGEEKYNELRELLIENNLYKTSLKGQLIEILDKQKIESKSFDDYIKSLNDNNIYARLVKGSNNIVYGIKNDLDGNLYYFKEKSLPERFSYKSFNQTNKTSFSNDAQKKFLKNNINMALKKTKSFNDFQVYLNMRNIELISHENKSGIYGLSFKATNIQNAEVFKASELDRSFSWNKISNNFIANSININQLNIPEAEILSYNELIPGVNEQPIEYYEPIHDVNKLRKFDKDDDDEPVKKKSKSNKRRR